MPKGQTKRITCSICKRRRKHRPGLYSAMNLVSLGQVQIHSKQPLCKKCNDIIIKAATQAATKAVGSLYRV